MRRIEKIIFISALTAFLLLVISNFTFAQRPLEVDYPTIEGTRPQDTSFTLPEYVKYIFNFSLAIAGLIAFAVLIYGGFGYLTSAGNPVKQKNARDRIFAAILGLIVLFCSYLILTTINPQLVFLSIPERVVLPQEPIIEPGVKEKEPLVYTEIPSGGLMGELLSDKRLESIKNVAEKTKEKAEEVKKLSKELNSLANQCTCALCSAQCAGACGGGFCRGDPCPVKEEINQKREAIEKTLSDLEEQKGLQYWQKKLDIEINGSSSGEERIIGFREVYEDLKSAENLIKGCPLSLNKKGHTQILLGYKDFWQYRQALEEDEEIKGGDPEYPFDYIASDNPYYLATFYCTEILYSIPETSINTEELSQIGMPIAVEEGEEVLCGSEISIGETTDNAEELARRMLIELDNISSNTLKEIGAAQKLINLADPGNCIESNCYTDCIWIERQCWESSPCPEEPPPEEPEPPGWDIMFFKPSSSFAAEDCGGWVDCSYCEILPCSGSLCPGDPAIKPQIDAQFSEIQNNNSQTASSYEKVENFIKEKAIEDKLKKSKILEGLRVAQNKLSSCYNSKAVQRKVLSGEEKVLWKELYSCSRLKEFMQWQVSFYDENGKKINACYGPDSENPDFLDNFLCCQTELF